MDNEFIPVCEPTLAGREKEYVSEAMETNWISSSGKFITAFEKGFASFCGCTEGISTTSGTSALHLALKALNIKPGDEVIIPNFTMIASMLAVLYCGAKPVFVDVDPETWNMDLFQVEKKISRKTKAIMVVHMFGNPVPMDQLFPLARANNIPIVEDAAEAHGAEYAGKMAGNLSDIACFSFFANKIITTGEGGMLVTSNKELANRCRFYKNLCFPLGGPRNYLHDDIGYNYRMTNVQAAIGLAQLEKIEDYVKARRAHAKRYNEAFVSCDKLQFQKETDGAKSVSWMYGLCIKTHSDRDLFLSRLKEKGVDTRIFFKPMNIQGAYHKSGFKDNARYPVTEFLSEKGFYIPSGSGLTDRQIDRVIHTILDEAKNL